MRTGESKVLILRAILRRSSLRSTGYKRRSYIHERRLRIDCAFLRNDCAMLRVYYCRLCITTDCA